jgi:hypothetical protein
VLHTSHTPPARFPSVAHQASSPAAQPSSVRAARQAAIAQAVEEADLSLSRASSLASRADKNDTDDTDEPDDVLALLATSTRASQRRSLTLSPRQSPPKHQSAQPSSAKPQPIEFSYSTVAKGPESGLAYGATLTPGARTTLALGPDVTLCKGTDPTLRRSVSCPRSQFPFSPVLFLQCPCSSSSFHHPSPRAEPYALLASRTANLAIVTTSPGCVTGLSTRLQVVSYNPLIHSTTHQQTQLQT